MINRINKKAYADMYGPTIGDKIRLADTDLIIEIEKDYATYGEEVKFGGGKAIRDGMGQSQLSKVEGAVDTVITNAIIIDYWGIIKADIGIIDGKFSKIGKAGNPNTQDNVDIIIGPGTEVIAAEGKIVTAGGVDAHIHFICPQQIDEALSSGITTMLGGGTGPAHGTTATTCTPGPWHIERMLQSADSFPVNLGFAGKGSVGLWGVGVKHDLLQWIPVVGDAIPISLPLQIGHTNLNTKFDVESADVKQAVELNVKATTINLIASKKILMLTGYTGVGYNSSSTSFTADTDLKLGNVNNQIDFDVPLEMSFESVNEFRANIGIRFNLTVIAFQANHTFSKYPVTTLGVGVSLR